MNTTSTANNKSAVHFTLNFFDKTITGTKASFDKAGKGFGAEYEELTVKMAAHPEFTLVYKEQKHKAAKAKRTYDGLNFSFMEDYIEIQENAADMMAEYKAVKQMAEKCGTKIYPLTKKWFLNKFSTETVPFDMGTAKEEINQHRIQAATESCSRSKDNMLDEAC